MSDPVETLKQLQNGQSGPTPMHPLFARLERHWLTRHLIRLLFPESSNDPALPGDDILSSRLTIRVIGLLMLVLLIWSILFTVDIASHSSGEVVNAGQTKMVQHLEGGIVRRIMVREGEKVSKGQPLAEIERVASESEMRELEAAIGALQIRGLRIEAQLQGQEQFTVPKELAARFPDQAEVAEALFKAQRQRLGSSYEEQKQKIEQRLAEQAELKSRQATTTSRLKLLREQIGISNRLMKQGLANRYEHLNLLKEEEEARGGLTEIEASLRRVDAALQQERAALQALGSGDRESLQNDLADVQRQMRELQERQRKFTDSEARSVMRAPIDGVVLTLNIVTQGGVLQPGGTLMTLVPADEPVLVEARLPIGDVGMVHDGQRARIQLMSSVAKGYRPIEGQVVDISPDSVMDEQKTPYYRVRIRPDELAFSRHELRYPLLPGVPVSIAILTGERSLFSYLAAPLVDGLRMAFSEP
jgi:adhesin transport system membrane fusion protein